MKKHPDQFKLDHCRETLVRWQVTELRNLIEQRMIRFSVDQSAPYRSLGELCEAASGSAEPLDAEIVRLAEGSPRAVVWLAGRLIDLHCEVDDPPRMIKPETWKRVQDEWRDTGRREVIGLHSTEVGLRTDGSKLFFGDKELHLPVRHQSLVECLLDANGGLCTNDDLAEAGWPGESRAGVTDHNIAITMNRVRADLETQGVDPAWIVTERGRGYRLQRPTGSEGGAS